MQEAASSAASSGLEGIRPICSVFQEDCRNFRMADISLFASLELIFGMVVVVECVVDGRRKEEADVTTNSSDISDEGIIVSVDGVQLQLGCTLTAHTHTQDI
eukprot:2883777-Ditylum_brightwellii.AAC.1